MNLVLGFLAGMFLANGVPHFVKGIIGQTHLTPFMKNSSALLNIIWAFINFVIGLAILNFSGKSLNEVATMDQYSWAFLGGAFVMSVACANLFSKPDAHLPWQK